MSDQLEQRVRTLEQAVAHLLQKVDQHDERIKIHSDIHSATSTALDSVRDFVKASNDTFTIIGEALDTPFVAGRRLDGVSCVVCHGEGCEFCPSVDDAK